MFVKAIITAVTITAFSLASSAGARAQAIPPTFPQKTPEMGPMRFLEGTWLCRAPGATEALKFTQSRDGMWILGTGKMALRSGGTEMAYLFMTYDDSSGRYVMISSGTAAVNGLGYSIGWRGDTMEWKSTAKGGTEDGTMMIMKRLSDIRLQITEGVRDQTGHQVMMTFMCGKSTH